jgi:uncharacterized membrane protein YgdD (TMEM256/DUF423 family)
MNFQYLRVGAGLGFFAVMLGAFGAHGLKPLLEAHETTTIWQTAVDYHFYHALAFLALGALPLSAYPVGRLRPVGFCWLVGLVVFSGSLYLLALTDLRWLGAVTPIGGTLLLAGWVLLFWRARPVPR